MIAAESGLRIACRVLLNAARFAYNARQRFFQEANMIDIKQIRAEPDKFIKAAKDKRIAVDISALLALDAETGAPLNGFAYGGVQTFGGAKNDVGQALAVSGAAQGRGVWPPATPFCVTCWPLHGRRHS